MSSGVGAGVRAQQGEDEDWHRGKLWSLVYFAGDDVAEVLKEAYTTFLYTNGLSVAAFKSLRKFESEVIAMTAELLGSSEAVAAEPAATAVAARSFRRVRRVLSSLVNTSFPPWRRLAPRSERGPDTPPEPHLETSGPKLNQI